MSIQLPSWLEWVASLAVGQHWPKGDEDGLRALGEAWDEAAQALAAMGEEIGPATQGVLSSIGGSVATEFSTFVGQLQSNLPQMADAAGQMGTLGKETGVQVEYAKYMILAQLAWLAVEIADLSWWAPEAIPAAVTAARIAVRMILRRLLMSIATGIGFMVGMDALIQAIQLLKGDRTHWDWKSTLSAVESGAVSGAIGGILGEGAGHFAPKFAGSVIGKGVVGGLTGVASAAALTGLFGGEGDYGDAFAGGAIGAMAGGGGRRGGGGAHVPKVDTPDVHLPSALDLHLPDVNPVEKPPAIPTDVGVPHAPAEGGLHTATGSGAPGVNGLPHTTEATLGGNDSAGRGTGTGTSHVNSATHTTETGAPGATDLTRTTGTPAPHTTPSVTETATPHTTPNVAETPAATAPARTAAPQEVSHSSSGLPGFETTLTTGGHDVPAPTADITRTEQAPPRTTTDLGSPAPQAHDLTVAPTVVDPSQAHEVPPESGASVDPPAPAAPHSSAPPSVTGGDRPQSVPTETNSPAPAVSRPITTETGPKETLGTSAPSVAAHSDAPPGTRTESPPAPREATATATASPGPSTPHNTPRPETVRPHPDPVRPDQWQHRRDGAPSSQVTTERFDPWHGAPKSDGTLPGQHTLIRGWVRRVQAEDGRWVRNISLSLPVRFGEGFHPDTLPAFEERWQAALDEHFNTGLQLPRSGDQLHIDLSLTPVHGDTHAIELSMSPRPGRSDQLNFRLQSEDPTLGPDRLQTVRQQNDLLGLHEFGHFAGLPDRYFEQGAIFRDSPAKSDDSGIMADVTNAPGEDVPKRYLETIENVTDSGPVVRDHPLSVPPQTTSGGGRPEHLTSLDGPSHEGVSQAPPKGIEVPVSGDHFDALGSAWKGWTKALKTKTPELTIDHPTATAGEVLGRITSGINAGDHLTLPPEEAATVLHAGQSHSFVIKSPTKKLVWTVKLSSPQHAEAQAAAGAHGSASTTGKPAGPSREQKFQLAGAFSQAMKDELGFTPMLSGGAAVAHQFNSPRPVNDLDFRVRQDAVGSLPTLLPRINEAVHAAFPHAEITPFKQDSHDLRAVTGKIDGVEVTIGPIVSTDYRNQHTENGVTVPEPLDTITDKAFSFSQRQGEKQAKDLFDLLWSIKDRENPGQELLTELVDRRGGLHEGPHSLPQTFADKLHDITQTNFQRRWKEWGATPNDVTQLKNALKQVSQAFPEPSGKPGMIVTAGNFTGDMFGLAGALVVNPELHVTVVSGRSHPDQISGFLKESLQAAGQSPDRVHTFDTGTGSPHTLMSSATHTDPGRRTALPTEGVHPPVPQHLADPSHHAPVSEATKQVGKALTDQWGGARRDRIRQAWDVGPQHDEAAHGFLQAAGIPPKGDHVVLWSRFSGKKGGPHPQHDTSITGLRQIIERLPRTTTVIIAGDHHPLSGDAKFRELVAQHPNVRDLTEFWNSDTWKAHFPGGQRADQFRLFDSLNRPGSGSTVKHLGFRSGNLEVYALLGHPVRYLEEQGNRQAGRMTAWDGLGYKRIVVEKPATLTGKWLVNHVEPTGAEPKVPWLHKGDGSAVSKDPGTKTTELNQLGLNGDRAGNRGFTKPDLDSIGRFLGFGSDAKGRTADPVSELDHAPEYAQAPAVAPVSTEAAPPAPHDVSHEQQAQPSVTHTEPAPAPVTDVPVVAAPRPAEAAPAPASAPPPAQADARHQRSLAGLKITDAPGPDAVRDRITTILGAHGDEQQVQQRLAAQLDPANFRAKHDRMVNGGWRFPLVVGGRPHEVLIEATPSPWRLTPGTGKDTGIEAASTAGHTPEPRTVDTTSSESGLDFGPSGVVPVNPHLNALVSGSVSAGGAGHAAGTSVKHSDESPNTITFTGPADSHTSTFTYSVRIADGTGSPLPHPPGEYPLITGDVTADIPRSGPPADDGARTWNGWNPTADDTPAQGHPVTVTGLDGIREALFTHLPEEERPDGLAHQAILDFLDPANVVNGFEHASGWGLDSPPMTFSDGHTGYLRLTLHPQESSVVGTVDHTAALGGKSTTEHSGSRSESSSRSVGASGGAGGQVWASPHDSETKWLTGTGGYSYSGTTANQAKFAATLTTQRSHERSGPADLVSTRVNLQVEVIKQHLSPGTDGLHATRDETVGLRDALPEPQPEPGHVVLTMEHPIPGEVLRVVPRPHAEAPAHAEVAPPPQPPTGRDLRDPLTAQRTTFLDVPGSKELEQHIAAQLHRQAPGLLPPPRGAGDGAHRVTPQAVENLRSLHQQLTPSALRGNGGKLLDGTFRITLDSSHLPGFAGRTYEITVQAHVDHDQATHLGNASSTGKDALGVRTAADRQIGQGSKHTVSLAGNLRSSLNPPDTSRAVLNASADGSYSTTHQVATGTETEVKREFTLESHADAFGYPVHYDVRIGPQAGTHAPSQVHLGAGQHLVAEVRPPVTPEAAPPRHLPLTELPHVHLVREVTNDQGFRQQAEASLAAAFRAKGSRAPDLSTALDSLTGQESLRGHVSASHASWSNSGTEHVGSGRNRDAVGLSVRTRLTGLTYRETLPGEGKLSVETKSGSSTTVTDKWSAGIKGGVGPDFVRYPENPVGLHESTYQVRGGFKVKGSYGRDGNDSVKTQVSVSHRTTTPKGTWHVYEADAHVTVTGRVVDARGTTTYGEPHQSDHRVLVLLSDEDVQRLTAPETEAQPQPQPQPPADAPQRRAPLLDEGLPAGTTVEFHSTDGILTEIDAQLRGPQPPGAVPTAALPFAETFSPHNLSANYSDLVGKGILDYHVQETRAGRTLTEVLVRGVPQEPNWRPEDGRSETDTTRTVTGSRTVKGNSGSSWTGGGDANLNASVRTPRAVDHLNNANWALTGGGELGRTQGAESGVTVKTERKTANYGQGHQFSNGMRFEVVVTRRTAYGRFVNLPKGPGTVEHPGRVTAWVPESLTRTGEVAPPPAVHEAPAPHEGPGLPGGGLELQPLAPHGAGDMQHWQQQLASGHDVVGFDQAAALRDNATRALATPRPWSDTFLGTAGRATTTALSDGAGLLGGALTKGAHAVLPASVTDMANRVVTSFFSDPRLDGHPLGGEFQGEQRLPMDQRLGVRQVFSGQSLPSVLGQARAPGAHDETVPLGADGKTSLHVSVTPTGPAEEVGTRENGEDTVTVSTEDASGTSATSTHSWSVAPASFSLTTNKPLVSVPFNGPKLTGEGSTDRNAPVTRTPGEPSRVQPPAALPGGLTAKEPGKAEIKGPQALMRQPVRVTVQKSDANGRYGAPVPTDGHLYYWSAKPASAEPPPATPAHPAEEPSTSEAPPEASATDTPPSPVTTAPPAPPNTPVESEPGTPHEPPAPPNTPAPATPEPPSPVVGYRPALPADDDPVEPHVVSFPAGNGTELAPDQLAAIDTAAAELAAQHTPDGAAPPTVTVEAYASVRQDGVPHFGRSLSLAAQRARTVAEALDAALAERGANATVTTAPHVGTGTEGADDDQAVVVITRRHSAPPRLV